MSLTTIELVPVEMRLNDPGAFRKIVMDLHNLNTDPAQLHRRIVEGAGTLLQCQDAALILLDAATEQLQVARVLANELPAALSPDLDLRDGVVGRVVANGVPVVNTEVAADGDYYPVFQGAASEATLPVTFGRRVLGALVVASPRVNAFSRQHIEALGMFADQVAIALGHAGRFASARAEADGWEELFRNFNDGLVVCDAGLKIQRASPAFLKMFNRSLAQLQNCAAQDVFYRLSIFGSREDFWNLLARHGRHDLKFRAPSGRRSFQLTGSRMTLQGDVAYLLVLRETTQQDELQDRLNRADKLASVTRVVSKIAHQLNNRLQSVVGLAEICGQKQADGAIAAEVRHIEEQSRRTATLVKSMMLHTQKVRPEFEELTANELVTAAVGAWRSSRLDSRVQFQSEVPERPIDISADRSQMQEVITHLLNHVQHALLTEPPAHDSRLVLQLSEREGKAVLVIAHNGFGLTPRALGRVFEPGFNRAENSEDTGLELHLCQHTVRANGGIVTCQSVNRDGLRFVLELPVHRKPRPVAVPLDVASDSPLAGLRVLVVDDDPVISGLMREVLSSDGVQAEAVTDAREGLRLAEEREFDLVLSDLKMPGMDGREFYRELREIRPALANRVIFATGDLPAQDTENVDGRSGPQFLMKPFSLDQLRHAISTRLHELRSAA